MATRKPWRFVQPERILRNAGGKVDWQEPKQNLYFWIVGSRGALRYRFARLDRLPSRKMPRASVNKSVGAFFFLGVRSNLFQTERVRCVPERFLLQGPQKPVSSGDPAVSQLCSLSRVSMAFLQSTPVHH
jgi:hypothetical protein